MPDRLVHLERPHSPLRVPSQRKRCLWPSVPSLRSSSQISGKYLSFFTQMYAGFYSTSANLCLLWPFSLISFLNLFGFLYLMTWFATHTHTPGTLQTGAHLLWGLQKRSNHRLVDRGIERGRGLGIQDGGNGRREMKCRFGLEMRLVLIAEELGIAWLHSNPEIEIQSTRERSGLLTICKHHTISHIDVHYEGTAAAKPLAKYSMSPCLSSWYTV